MGTAAEGIAVAAGVPLWAGCVPLAACWPAVALTTTSNAASTNQQPRLRRVKLEVPESIGRPRKYYVRI
jgi:hypothetical protein